MHPSVQAANGFRTSRFLARNRTASSSNSHAVPRAPHTAARGGRYPCAGASASGSECSTSPTPLARRHLLQAGLVTSAAWAAQQLQPARAEAAILVGPAQSGGKFATINEAIAAAEQGGIITVLPGRYEERITLDGKFVTIQAAQVWREPPLPHADGETAPRPRCVSTAAARLCAARRRRAPASGSPAQFPARTACIKTPASSVAERHVCALADPMYCRRAAWRSYGRAPGRTSTPSSVRTRRGPWSCAACCCGTAAPASLRIIASS
jgi:hypothetical protein